MFKEDVIEYAVRDIKVLREFSTSKRDLAKFGFPSGSRVLTPKGPSWVIGEYQNSLYFHIDGDTGASKWGTYRDVDFRRHNFKLLSSPVGNTQELVDLYFQRPLSTQTTFSSANPSSRTSQQLLATFLQDGLYSDVTFYLPRIILQGEKDLSDSEKLMDSLIKFHTMPRESMFCTKYVEKNISNRKVAKLNDEKVGDTMVNLRPISYNHDNIDSYESENQHPNAITHSQENTSENDDNDDNNDNDDNDEEGYNSSKQLSTRRSNVSMSRVKEHDNTLKNGDSILQKQKRVLDNQQEQLSKIHQIKRSYHELKPKDDNATLSATPATVKAKTLTKTSMFDNKDTPFEQYEETIPDDYGHVHAHKILLAMNSTFFHNLFSFPNEQNIRGFNNQPSIFILDGIAVRTFRFIVTYLYQINATTIPFPPYLAIDVALAAQFLCLDHLVERAALALVDAISEENVVFLFSFADALDMEKLKAKCLNFCFNTLDSTEIHRRCSIYSANGGSTEIILKLMFEISEDRKRARDEAILHSAESETRRQVTTRQTPPPSNPDSPLMRVQVPTTRINLQNTTALHRNTSSDSDSPSSSSPRSPLQPISTVSPLSQSASVSPSSTASISPILNISRFMTANMNPNIGTNSVATVGAGPAALSLAGLTRLSNIVGFNDARASTSTGTGTRTGNSTFPVQPSTGINTGTSASRNASLDVGTTGIAIDAPMRTPQQASQQTQNNVHRGQENVLNTSNTPSTSPVAENNSNRNM